MKLVEENVQKTSQKRFDFPEFHLSKKQEIPGNMTQENVQKTFQKRSEILIGITSRETRMARVPLEILFAGVCMILLVPPISVFRSVTAES